MRTTGDNKRIKIIQFFRLTNNFIEILHKWKSLHGSRELNRPTYS